MPEGEGTETVEATESVAKTVNTDSEIPKNGTDVYWSTVYRALTEVFKKEANEADALVRGMMNKIDQRKESNASSDLERVAIFHVDPIQVAADLGGARDRPLTQQEKQDYAAIRSQDLNLADQPNEASFKREVPDDTMSVSA
jgi:hypothetical protein